MNFDTAALKRIYKTKNGKIVLDFLSGYERNMSEGSAPHIYAGIDQAIGEWEVRDVLRDIAATGAGKFVTGRKGHYSRIIWGNPGVVEICKSLNQPDVPMAVPVSSFSSLSFSMTPKNVRLAASFLQQMEA